MKTKIDSILFCGVKRFNKLYGRTDHYTHHVSEHFNAYADIVPHSDRWMEDSFAKYKERKHSLVIIVDDGRDWLSLAYAKTWFESKGVEWFFILSELKSLDAHCETIDFNRCMAVTCPIDDQDSIQNVNKHRIPWTNITNTKEEYVSDNRRIGSTMISYIEQHLL